MYGLLAFLSYRVIQNWPDGPFVLEQVPGPNLPAIRRPDWLPIEQLPGGFPREGPGGEGRGNRTRHARRPAV